MKVKLFDLEDEKDLEEAINDFLEDMKGELWDIKYQVSSSIYGEEQVYCFSAMYILLIFTFTKKIFYDIIVIHTKYGKWLH